MKKIINLIMHLEELHPKMQKHITEGAVAFMAWMLCFMLYVVFIDMAIASYYSTNIALTVFMFGMAVFLTNVFIVLTRVSFRAIVLMVKTSRKAIQVLNNK